MTSMLRCLNISLLMCTDEVDKTASTHNWSKKAAESIEELNKDCNMTAGLQAKL